MKKILFLTFVSLVINNKSYSQFTQKSREAGVLITGGDLSVLHSITSITQYYQYYSTFIFRWVVIFVLIIFVLQKKSVLIK